MSKFDDEEKAEIEDVFRKLQVEKERCSDNLERCLQDIATFRPNFVLNKVWPEDVVNL